MNTLRSLFSVRTLVALRQNALCGPPPVDAPPANRLSTAPAANNNNNNLYHPKELLSTSLVRNTLFGVKNESLVQQYKQLDRKLEIVYRCKVCNTRNKKTISEAAYQNGVVILQCDGCSTTHLIVDNLGWFANSKGKSVNEVLAEKGELVQKIVVNEKGEILKN